MAQVTPDRIMQTGLAFMASKTLLLAVKLGVFTRLDNKSMSGTELGKVLDIHSRSLFDFLDALVALAFLERDGIKQTSEYRNAPESQAFLVQGKATYLGAILEMCNDSVYNPWGNLDEYLQTGKPQAEGETGESVFATLYSSPEGMKQFLQAMGGVHVASFAALSKAFDFSPYKTLCDVGGAGGDLCIQLALNVPHLSLTTHDLAAVAPIAQENIKGAGFNDRIQVSSGDFFKDTLPKADIITMGNILHDWGLDGKRTLLQKAFRALPEGGAFIVIEDIIDNDRSKSAIGLLMSLNMLVKTSDGFNFGFDDFEGWAKEAGFRKTELIPLAGPSSAAVAYK